MVGSGHSALSIHVSLSAAMSADYHPSQLCVATLSAMAGADGVWRCAASTVVESSTSAAPLQRAVLRASLDRLAEEGVVVAVLRQHAVPPGSNGTDGRGDAAAEGGLMGLGGLAAFLVRVRVRGRGRVKVSLTLSLTLTRTRTRTLTRTLTLTRASACCSASSA